MLNEEYEVQLLQKLPVFHRKIYEYQQISKAQTPELEALLVAVDNVLNNWFIATADEYGIKRFESIMGIYPEEGETLETRRFKILVKLNDPKPYTEEVLRELLSELCGEDGYVLIVDNEKYVITVKLDLQNEHNFTTVKELLERVVPANMVQNISLFNTHKILSKFTHEQLAQYTQKDLRSTVIS